MSPVTTKSSKKSTISEAKSTIADKLSVKIEPDTLLEDSTINIAMLQDQIQELLLKNEALQKAYAELQQALLINPPVSDPDKNTGVIIEKVDITTEQYKKFLLLAGSLISGGSAYMQELYSAITKNDSLTFEKLWLHHEPATNQIRIRYY